MSSPSRKRDEIAGIPVTPEDLEASLDVSRAGTEKYSMEGAESSASAPGDAAGDEEDEAELRQEYRFTHQGEPVRLDTFLAERCPEHSRSYLKRLIETEYVQYAPPADRPLKPSTRIQGGQVVRVVIPPPLRLRLRPEAIPLDILYEDECMAVVVKPAGLSMHPSPDQVGRTLVNALLHWLGDDLSGIAGVERPGVVHRLDKETSGVLLVAKNDRAHVGLQAQFKERKVHKTYQAVVRGEPEHWEGRIDLPIGRSPTHSKKMVTRPDGGGRTATTDYRVLEVYRGYALVECYPLSGRTHQIRVHMASQRLPVAADKLYGREKSVFLSDLRERSRQPNEKPVMGRQALHAASISFRHPITQEEMTFEAPLPRDFLDLLHALQTHRSHR